MGNHVISIDFHGSQLVGLENEHGTFAALRPIVEGMGLDWSGQYRRLGRDPILQRGVAMMATPLGQEQVFLRLDLLPGWLFTIDHDRVKPELRDRVLLFKEECHRVLAGAFIGPSKAPSSETLPADTMGQEHARKLVVEARHLFGEVAGRQLWFALGLPTTPAMHGPVQLTFPFGGQGSQGGQP